LEASPLPKEILRLILDYLRAIQGSLFGRWGSTGERPSEFQSPHGITTDGKVVCVSDSYNHRIQLFSSNGEFIAQFGRKGIKDGQFQYPKSLCIDPIDGSLFVADSDNFRIQVLKLPELQFRHQFYAHGKCLGLAISSSQRLYVSLFEDHQIAMFTTSGELLLRWGATTTGKGKLNTPKGMTILEERLYVADSGHDRVCVFNLEGEYLSQWGSIGDKENQFERPQGITHMDSFLFCE